MNWQQELREQRQARILEAAARILGRRGFQQATMKEIADEAGIAPGTIYLYFENKRDLLLSIADQLLSQELDRQMMEWDGLDEESLLRQLLYNRFAFTRENEPFVRALFTAVWTDAEIRDRFFGGIIGPLFVMFGNYLQTRMQSGGVRPHRAEVVVPALAGSFLIFAILRNFAPPGIFPSLPDAELTQELVNLYLYGLKPRQEEGLECSDEH